MKNDRGKSEEYIELCMITDKPATAAQNYNFYKIVIIPFRLHLQLLFAAKKSLTTGLSRLSHEKAFPKFENIAGFCSYI